jgi:REP element-mobilizing transposase RayT
MSQDKPSIQFRHKSIRLRGYDYTTEGIYFVTICSLNREPMFGSIKNDKMLLSEIGGVIEDTWCDIPNHHPNVSLDHYVIMPNHLHGLIVLSGPESIGQDATSSRDRARLGRAATTEAFGRPVAGSLPTVVRSFKSASTWRVSQSRNCQGKSVWQRNYYEHIIRNDDVLFRAREYIVNNPLKWALDSENPDAARQTKRTT